MLELKVLTVDELADRLLVGVAVGDKRLDNLQHLHGSLGELDEDTVVDLEQAEQLQGLALLGVDLVNALDADHKGKLRLGRDVEAVTALGLAGKTNLLPLGIAVLLDVLLSTREDDLALLLALVCCSLSAQSTPAACDMESTKSDWLIPERWLTIDNIDRSLAGVGSYNHRNRSSSPSMSRWCIVPRFSLVAIARSSRALSWDLRFLRSVSGIRMSF